MNTALETECPSQHDDAIERRFHELAETWHDETGMLSSVSKILGHPAYQSIIELGHAHPDKVLTLILTELEQRPSMWFEALKSIANETPVETSERSDTKRVREAWLKWGREKHLIR